jgi:hypothetical protein
MASKQELEWLDEIEQIEREAWRELGARREAERLAEQVSCYCFRCCPNGCCWCDDCGETCECKGGE